MGITSQWSFRKIHEEKEKLLLLAGTLDNSEDGKELVHKMRTGNKELKKEKNLKIITRNMRHYPEKSLLSEFSLKLALNIYYPFKK